MISTREARAPRLSPDSKRACQWPTRGAKLPGRPARGPGPTPRPARPVRPCSRKNCRTGPAQSQ
eukprot:2140953-Heterocapsa_arctica.AAC.1